MQSTSRIWLGDDGIMRIRFPRDYQFTLDDIQDLNRQHREISRDCRPLLVYAESVASAEHEAQQFASSEEVIELVSALAIIVQSFFSRALADIFMRFHKPPYPTRVFNREEDALLWLEPYCKCQDSVDGERGESA